MQVKYLIHKAFIDGLSKVVKELPLNKGISLKRTYLCPAFFQAPSIVPTAAKAQQDPHWPWFLMGVTKPLTQKMILKSISLIFQLRIYIWVP